MGKAADGDFLAERGPAALFNKFGEHLRQGHAMQRVMGLRVQGVPLSTIKARRIIGGPQRVLWHEADRCSALLRKAKSFKPGRRAACHNLPLRPLPRNPDACLSR